MNKFNKILEQRIKYYKRGLYNLYKGTDEIIEFCQIPLGQNSSVKLPKNEKIELSCIIDRLEHIKAQVYKAISENPKDY